jgi:hypothetical protein
LDIIKNASEKLSVVKGKAGESVCTKLQAVSKRNLGFLAFTSVCQVHNEDDVDPPEDIAPEKIPYQIKDHDPRKYEKHSNSVLCIKKNQ